MEEIIVKLESELIELKSTYGEYEKQLKQPCPSCSICDSCRPQKENLASMMDSLSREINSKDLLIKDLKNI